MVRHYATRKTFLMHLVTHALGEQCGLFVAAPLLEAKLYAPGDHCRRAQLAGVDLEFMLAAAARGLPIGDTQDFFHHSQQPEDVRERGFRVWSAERTL